MSTSVMEKTGEHIADTTHTITDNLRGCMGNARKFVKDTEDLADELYDTSTRQIRRHPAEAVTMTFFAGVAVGMLVGWLVGRK